MKRLRLTALTVLGLLAVRPAFAHEPLWGESPQTFAFGVSHPELRFGFENDSLLLRGSHRLSNLDALRRTRFDTLIGYQYAVKTSLNLRVEVPLVQALTRQRINGQMRSSGATGLGDVVLSAKSRFYQKFGTDWKVHQSYTIGLQLPTGAHTGRYPNGLRLAPSDQPGSGKWGVMLGYAFAYERLQDTVWASALYTTDLGGTGSKGDMLQLTANYGYWVRRARKPQDLGIVLAGGPLLEIWGRDKVGPGTDADTGYTLAGLQASLIATHGQMQFRLGVLIPVMQRVNGTQLRADVQARAGFEILL